MNDVIGSGNALMPQTYEEKYEMAGVLSKSGLIPKGLDSPEKVFVALQWGHELGLSPMVAVNNVAVINGKPTLSADIMAAVVKRSPEYGGIEWVKNSETEAECIITRVLQNGQTEKMTSRFTIDDAKKAGLAGRDVWQKYPKRMLKHRCLSYGLKDMFPDLLAGLYTPEEMENVDATGNETTKLKNVTPEPALETPKETVNDDSKVDRETLKMIIQTYEEQLRGQPYELSCEALADGNPEKIHEMVGRCITYLGRKGIKVA